MCHGQPISAFPAPTDGETIDSEVRAYAYGSSGAERVLAILPDIFGFEGFYQGLALRYAGKGARALLIDPFHGLGKLENGTREEAFARRARVQDKEFLDRFQAFCASQSVSGVIGFCLGGLYVFELARRNMNAKLVGLYGFPQGLPNEDALPVPFDYLAEVTKRHVMLMGADDESVGPENIEHLAKLASENEAIALTVYDGVGHNFLPLLDSEDPAKVAIARDALERCDSELLGA